MALIDLVDKISSNMDHKKYYIGVFLDLSKVFDTIDRNILLNKGYSHKISDSWLQGGHIFFSSNLR